ncbi:MAG: hypothetical protein HOG49_05315, partial [Candidatus Scalindua sp.]|nr:hypothetical protein [Candidatus Scalindua sp.]
KLFVVEEDTSNRISSKRETYLQVKEEAFHYYSLDDTVSGSVRNNSENGFGIVIGYPLFRQKGRTNYSMKFSGDVEAQGIHLPSRPNGDCTIAMWVKLEYAENWQALYMDYRTNDFGMMYHSNSSGPGGTGLIRIYPKEIECFMESFA